MSIAHICISDPIITKCSKYQECLSEKFCIREKKSYRAIYMPNHLTLNLNSLRTSSIRLNNFDNK